MCIRPLKGLIRPFKGLIRPYSFESNIGLHGHGQADPGLKLAHEIGRMNMAWHDLIDDFDLSHHLSFVELTPISNFSSQSVKDVCRSPRHLILCFNWQLKRKMCFCEDHQELSNSFGVAFGTPSKDSRSTEIANNKISSNQGDQAIEAIVDQLKAP